MRATKIFLFFLCLIVCSLSFPPKVSASSFVTETASSITIENDYYKLILQKTGTYGGAIKDFYIKPETTVDIAGLHQYEGMGMHEWQDADNATDFQWQGEGTSYDTTTTILKQTNSYVITYSTTNLTVTGGRWMQVEEWRTFYEGERYILDQFVRTYGDFEECAQNQVCFLFDRNWTDGMYFLNQSGQVENVDWTIGDNDYNYLNPFLWQIEINQTYPWFMYYNATHNTGLGVVLTDVSRPGQFQAWWDLRDGSWFVEPQLTFRENAYYSSGDQEWASYFFYVTIASYTGIESFAESLHSATSTAETPSYTIQASSSLSTRYQGWIPVFRRGSTISANFLIYLRTGACADNDLNTYFRFIYRNDTFNDYCWDYSSATQIAVYRNSTYINATWNYDFESKIRMNVTFEVWTDSDVIKITDYIEMLSDCNILRFIHDWIPDTMTNFSAENGTYSTLINATGNGYSQMGLFVQNKTGRLAGDGSESWAYFENIIYYTSQTLLSAGWNGTYIYYVQPIRKNLEDGAIGSTDFLALHQSELKNYNNYWVNLYDASGMRVKDFCNDEVKLLHHKLEGDTLDLVTYADEGVTSTLEIYIGDKGEPESVSGATWSYSDGTGLLTLNITHSSFKDVSVSWTQQNKASGYFILSVHVKQGDQGLSSVSVTVKPLAGSKNAQFNKTTNYQGIAQFQLPYGSYLVQAYYENKIKSMRVWLTGNKEVGFDFSTPPGQGSLLDGWILLPLVGIVLVLVFWRVRK